MKSGFKDPIAIKNQKPKDKPIDCKPVSLGMDFRCMQYDQRSSSFVKAGTNYGVGYNQPVGGFGDAKMRVDCLPFGRIDTMKVGEPE